MAKVRIAFQTLGDEEGPPPTFQEIRCHLIFDVKMENFQRKARLVAGGHMTETPASVTFASVVSRESSRIRVRQRTMTKKAKRLISRTPTLLSRSARRFGVRWDQSLAQTLVGKRKSFEPCMGSSLLVPCFATIWQIACATWVGNRVRPIRTYGRSQKFEGATAAATTHIVCSTLMTY
jgi:hypothetical protein